MNPMTNVKNIKKLSELELKRGNFKSSWHDQYKDSAWLFVGGLPYDLSEGDVICVFSQYGEIVNINLVRDKGTGKSKGFCFICYEDQRSTVLAVDNFNGIKLLGRTIRVDHVTDYKAPKDSDKLDDETRKLHAEGCAPKEIAETEEDEVVILKTIKKEKKEKIKPKVKKEKKRRRKKKKSKVEVTSSSSSDTESESDTDDSDSTSKRSRRSKGGKHSSKKHNKKLRESESESESEEEEEEVVRKESAKSKRQQLEEKIRVLEQALNSVKNASRRNQLNSSDQVSDSKTNRAATKEEFHDRERPSASIEYKSEAKHRAENESQDRRRDYNSHSGSDHRDRSSSRNNGYRSRDSGGRRSDEINGTREKEWSRERDRYDERSRDRDHSDRERYRDREYDRDPGRRRDRSRDRHRR